MYISILITSLYSQGAEYVAASMARGLFAAGHKVDVVVSAVHDEIASANPEKAPFPLTEGIHLVHLPGRRARQNIVALRQYIKRNRPDVVLNNAGPFMLALSLARLLIPWGCKTKIVHVEHSSSVGCDSSCSVMSKFFTKIRCFLLNRYDGVFAVSEGTRLQLCSATGFPLERAFTVYNPAIDVMSQKIMQLPSRHPWLNKKEIPVVVAAGAFCKFKNHLLLIRAFAKVCEVVQCRLIIFGDGPLRSDYENELRKLRIEDKVSLPGYTNQLPAEIKAADVFVVSSDGESFSIVLVEALAAGTPVVSTDAPYGPPEILEYGKYGILVKRGNVDSMSAGIIKALSGYEIVPPKESYERFRIENIVKNYESGLRSIGVNG